MTQEKYLQSVIEDRFGSIAHLTTIPGRDRAKWIRKWGAVARYLFAENQAELGEIVFKHAPSGITSEGVVGEFLYFLVNDTHAEVADMGDTFLVRFPVENHSFGYFYSGNPDSTLRPADLVEFIVTNIDNETVRALHGWEMLLERLSMAMEKAKQDGVLEYTKACAVSADDEY